MNDQSTPHDHGFYVGYLPAPAAHARMARGIGIAVIVAFAALAGLLAVSQSNPGGGTWDASGGSMLEGTLLVDPYPHLLTIDERGNALDAVLVEQGKFGATPRALPFAGQRVRIKGGLIRWGTRAALELAGTPDDMVVIGGGIVGGAIEDRPVPTPVTNALHGAARSVVTLEGEIVDPKCYLGVMNPGHGKPHLSCAELCIRGGIPPVLVVRDRAGESVEGDCHLLAILDGRPANELVRGKIGHRVRVAGVLRAATAPGGWSTLMIERIDVVE